MYCTTCRLHFEGESPPHAVRHISPEEHLHPETGEPVTPIPPMGWPRVTRRGGQLTGYWRESEAEALDRYVIESESMLVVEEA